MSYFFWAVTESEDQVDFAATYGDDPSGWTIGDAINYRFLDTVTWYTDGWGRTARFQHSGHKRHRRARRPVGRVRNDRGATTSVGYRGGRRGHLYGVAELRPCRRRDCDPFHRVVRSDHCRFFDADI